MKIMHEPCLYQYLRPCIIYSVCTEYSILDEANSFMIIGQKELAVYLQ